MSTTTNFLKYTGLSYADIVTQISNSLAGDARFDNFRESAIAQTMLEIFAGTADMVNYYIERQAEESFFETSKRRSSAILLSRNLGYDITRPIPSECAISITLKGDFRGKVSVGTKLQFPVYTVFTYKNMDLLLEKGFTYTFTVTDWNSIQALGAAYEKVITTDDNGVLIKLIQGTIKENIIEGTTNPQVGQTFQTYKISDTTFSNKYGEQDYVDFHVTKVYVGASKTSDTEYLINRRSLINDDTIAGVINNEEVKCCVLRTSTDEGVDLLFGKTKLGEIGADIISTGQPTTTFDNIYLQYLSTLGSKANTVGIINERLTYSSTIILNTQNVTSQVRFLFTANLTGGGDMEETDEIKTNSPAIFYSLDRLVSKTDHINYLKTLTSPIDVKNALAWGEQEEAAAIGVLAIQVLFNVGFFSCIGSMYNLDGDIETETYGIKTGTDLGAVVLDAVDVLGGTYDENGYSNQNYFFVYTKNNVAAQAKATVTPAIQTVLDALNKRGQITIRYIYISPVIQSMKLTGTVYINQLHDKADLNRRINNDIYSFLDSKADYDVPVYRSNLVEIIESYPGVTHADVKFEPDIPVTTDPSHETDKGIFFYCTDFYAPVAAHPTEISAIYTAIFGILNAWFGTTMQHSIEGMPQETWWAFIDYTRTLTPDKIQIYDENGKDKHSNYTNLYLTNERKYMTFLTKNMYDAMSGLLFRDSDDFITTISDIHKDLTWLIRCNMIDSNGNIAPEYTITENTFGLKNKTYKRGGYSLGCEIVRVNLAPLSYEY